MQINHIYWFARSVQLLTAALSAFRVCLPCPKRGRMWSLDLCCGQHPFPSRVARSVRWYGGGRETSDGRREKKERGREIREKTPCTFPISIIRSVHPTPSQFNPIQANPIRNTDPLPAHALKQHR
ncbi:hypothetical protein BC567DRAFT_228718 [Phyllosticta citribraziliensis]